MRVTKLVSLLSLAWLVAAKNVATLESGLDVAGTVDPTTGLSSGTGSGKKNVVSSLDSGSSNYINTLVQTKDTGSSAGKSDVIINDDDDDDDDDKKESGASNPFLMSISMIIVSEIGDKTFLIAALMAMKLSRLTVFSALFAALAIMTILSGIVGHTLPALIPQQYTQILAGGLFVVFGYKLLKEGLAMSKEVGVDEEMAEVEEEIAMNDINQSMDQAESGEASASSKDRLYQYLQQLKSLFSFVLSPLWVQVFVMTFLGEWGDRSQIATIAMAAGSDYWLVIAGAVIGHGICTGGAVLGGKLLATRISMRTVTLGGAVAFFIFSVLYFYDAFTGEQDS